MTFCRHLLDPGAVYRDDGEFCCDVETVEKYEDEDGR